MLEALRSWILGLAGAAVFCAVMTEIVPKGPVKNIVKTLCGMVMAIALLSPLLQLDLAGYSLNMAKYRQKGEEIVSGGKEITDNLSRTIIEEECRAYILDKAAALGAELSDAAVTLKWSSEGCWYPVECALEGEYNARLASAIESELGIGEENQKWRSDENS